MGITVGIPDRVLDRGWDRDRCHDGVVDAMAEPPDELRVKACCVCKHSMELIERDRENKLEPRLQWECLCGHREFTTSAKDWGEV